MKHTLYKLMLLKRNLLLAMLIFLSFGSELMATHIIGGELRYKVQDDGRILVHLTFFRECDAASNVRELDAPANIGIFDGDGNLIRTLGRGGVLILSDIEYDTVDEKFGIPCRESIEDVCYEQVTMCGLIELPFRAGGYDLVFQRCCRNSILTNIVDPLNAGMTLVSHVSEEALLQSNSAAIMKAWPPIYTCIDEHFSRDMGATDADGDELRYRLYTPNLGATLAESRPIPPSNPPYDNVVWSAGYSEDDMMTGLVPFSIDAQSGVISATPGTIGFFLVGVAVEEYRDGELINVTTREYEIKVGECQNTVRPEIAYQQQCFGPVQFEYLSDDAANKWSWFFDWDGDRSLTSDEMNPLFFYSEPGTYQVAVIAQDTVDNCIDTVFRTITLDVVDSIGIVADPNLCVPRLFTFGFNSPDSIPADSIRWNFGDGSPETNDNFHFYTEAGTYTVTAIINTVECMTSVTLELEVEDIALEFPDTIRHCNLDSTLIEHANSTDCDYLWSDTSLFVNPRVAIPTFIGEEEGYIYVLVSDPIDSRISYLDSIYVLFEDPIEFDDDPIEICPGIPFEINPDGNDSYTYMWSPASLFDDPTAINPQITVFTDTTVVVQTTDTETGCVSSFMIQIELIDPGVELDFAFNNSCGSTLVEFLNTSEDTTFRIEWLYDEMVISEENQFEFDFGALGSYTVTLRSYLPNGCIYDIVKTIQLMEFDPMIQDEISACTAGELIQLNPGGETNFSFNWSGPGITEENRMDPNPEVEAIDGALYEVIVAAINDSTCKDTFNILVNVLDELDLILEDSTSICDSFGGIISVQNADQFTSIVWTAPDGSMIQGDVINLDRSFGLSGYYVSRASNGECEFVDSVFIDAREYRLDANTPGPYCVGDTVVFNINDESGNIITDVDWQNSENIVVIMTNGNQAYIMVNGPGQVSGVVTYEDGCMLPFMGETLDVISIDGLSISISSDTIINGETATITVSGAGSNVTYIWEPSEYIMSGQGTATITVNPPSSQTYTVTVRNEAGCEAILSISLFVVDAMCNDDSYFIPNTFTPNGDNLNDEWCVKSRIIPGTDIGDIEEVFLIVYDRWGEEVFKQTGTPEATCWDGTFKDELLGPDVYGYYVRMTCIGGETIEKRGNVTLLR